MATFLTVQALDNQSSSGTDPTTATDGIAVPRGHEGQQVHMQIVIAGGTSVTYQASLWGFRSSMQTAAGISVSDGSESAWVQLFATSAAQTKSQSWAMDELAGEYSRLAVVLDAIAGTTPDIDAALAFSSTRG